MGYDATCTLTTDGSTYRGTARLEEKELIFRGDRRLVIPLVDIQEVHAREGTLFVTFAERRAVFEIGESADRWAKRIAHPPSRADKLGVKDGMRIALQNCNDDEALVRELEGRGAVVQRNGRSTGLDMIFFGPRTLRDLDRLAVLASRIKPDGAIWLVRTKGREAAISEAQSMAAGKRAGLVDVKVVSFSDSHSAEKYVIPRSARPAMAEKRGRSDRSASPSPRTRESVPSRARN